MSMKRSLRATPPSPITAPKLVTLAWLVVLSMLLPLSELTAQARLRAIPDESLSGLPQQIALGDTQLNWAELSPLARAQLIQVLAGRRYTVHLAAWDGAGDPQDAASRFDRDRVEIADPTQARWWFSVRNEGKVARRMRWQLSRFPFDETVDDWRAPAGMLAAGEVLRQSDRSLPERFEVDLGEYLLGGNRTNSALPAAVALTSMLHENYPTGTMYLRLMALGRNGSPISMPSNSIRIDLRPLSSGEPIEGPRPQVGVAGFQMLRPLAADARCWVRGTRALEVAPAESIVENAPEPHGEPLAVTETAAVNLCSSEHSDVLALVANAFGSTEGMTERMRQWGRQRLESVSELIRDETQSNFGGVTAACTSQCRQAITLVLEQVVSLSGGPPHSVFPSPTWPELQPYVQRMLRSALARHSSLGEAFLDQATAGATELFMTRLADPGGLTPPAFEPAAEHQIRMPAIVLQLHTEQATEGRWLQLRELSRTPRVHPVLIPVPPMLASDRIAIPVQLSSTDLPDLSDLMLPSRSALLQASNTTEALMHDVTSRLRGLDKALTKAQRKAISGKLRLELAWRDADGRYQPIGIATCRADRDDSCQLSTR